MSNLTFSLLAQAAPAAPGTRPQGGFADMLIPFVCFGVIIYFLIIRPQQKRQKEQDALLSSVKMNDEVVTAGGIYGRIANVKETTFMLKIADNVRIEIDKSAVARVVKSAAASAEKAEKAA